MNIARIITLSVLVLTLPSCCTLVPQPTETPTSTPTSLPTSINTPEPTTIAGDQTEKELVSLMLDFIIQQKIEGFETGNQRVDASQMDTLMDASLIVLLPANKNYDRNRFDYLKYDEPIKVWLYDDRRLEDVPNTEEAIQKYQEVYMSHNPNPEAGTWFWGFYQFGILSVSENNTRAKIYLVDSR